jgi:hypothetical protein
MVGSTLLPHFVGWHHRNYLHLIVLQHDRFQGTASSDFEQRREVIILGYHDGG